MTVYALAPEQRFKAGDIIRYADGTFALFRYAGTNVGHRLYGEHILGGSHGAENLLFREFAPASESDLELCRKHRPDWFAGSPVGDPDETLSLDKARTHCADMLRVMRACRERGAPVWIWDNYLKAIEIVLEASNPAK